MEWYQKQFRRNLIDMHIEDWDDIFLSQFDSDNYVEMLKLGHIGAPMLYFQSHVGLCYWPTQSGKMHEAFQRQPDMMKQVERKCHEAGLNVVAYYSLIYNNWAYDTHPGWRMLDGNGKGLRSSGYRYGLCCPNNETYRAFVDTQIQEFCAYFNFEGIFLDMTYWPMVCYCDACKARWATEMGGKIPTELDWRDPAWLDFVKKRSEWIGEFARWSTGLIQKYKPGCTLEHQYSTIMDCWRMGVTENISAASDYAGGDLYGGIAEQSFACKLYYGVTQNQPFEYMTSRCYPGLAEHTTTKSLDLLRLSVMMTYLHHGACLLIDAIDPSGTLDRRVYERIGEVFRETEAYEKWLSWGKQAFDVSLYFDLNGKYNAKQNPAAIGSGVEDARYVPMLHAQLGAARSLWTHHIPYTVINNWKPERMREGKAVALCDVPGVSEQQQDDILAFVRDGGSLYMSGATAPKILKEIFNLEYDGYTRETQTYISPTEAGESLMGMEYTKEYPLVLFETQAKVKGSPKGEVLGTATLPYTVPATSEGGDCIEPFFAKWELSEEEMNDPALVRFASIHSNPPGKYTAEPALIRAEYGKGKAVWCAAPIEKMEREQHSNIFAHIMAELCGNKFVFSAKVPECVECVLFDAPEHNAKLMGVINLQESFHALPVYDLDVRVTTGIKPSSAYLLPDEKPLEFDYADGVTTVHFDKMELYAMYVLEL